ncbi:MAG: sodium/proline symporter [Simkaniaceae bacterium]|nr:sodium/proline symporter [Simkaniaceae bacterium]
MLSGELFAIILYVSILLTIGYFSSRKKQTSADFLIGGRSMNFYLTALSAHASDMSSWLFMGFPAAIFLSGVFKVWYAVGLALFMYLNWQFVAPRIRVMTEQYNALTFSSFFESRLSDTSGLIRIFTALMSLLFYSIYISAGLVALGVLLETLFHLNYHLGITLSILIVVPYLFFGGYKTLAWIDLFQGLFLLAVIAFVPLYAVHIIGGFSEMHESLTYYGRSLSLFPDFHPSTLLGIILTILGWGLGYFGQPHITTKFMGIERVEDMRKAKYVGMSWQIIALGAACLVGLIGVPFFKGVLANPELVFINMVRDLFSPFLIGLILCAALAATISTMDSQILVLATTLTEDFYKRVFRKNATSQELLFISRLFIVLTALLSYLIAFFRPLSIYELVFFAWSGLGASFGPLLLFTLYSKRINKYGAWAGILSGGLICIIWSYFNTSIDRIIPAFFISSILIYLVSICTSSLKEDHAHSHN